MTCKAQNIIKSSYSADDYAEDGVYYKDMDNDYNQLEGTWLYTDGNTSLLITLEKKVMNHIVTETRNYYTDALVGEYKYIEDGIEKVNTLANLDIDYDNPYKYNITGGTISKPGDALCHNCGPDDVKVFCSFSDPERDIVGSEPRMIFRQYIENDVEKIEINFLGGGMISVDEEDIQDLDMLSYRLPYGQYTLTKQ